MIRDKLPAYTMYHHLFPKVRPLFIAQATSIGPANNVDWKKEGFALKGAKFAWKEQHKKQLGDVIKEIASEKSIVHTNPNKPEYWISQHRLDREIKEDEIRAEIRRMKRDQDYKDSMKEV
jgi:hypothetical protein